ncbi:hypothetical protein ACSBR1_017696 [Camellia fascicularis]
MFTVWGCFYLRSFVASQVFNLALKLDKLVKNDEEARSDIKIERLVIVAIWCTQEDPSIRPSMRKITQMLGGVLEVSVPPRPSIFSTS